MAVKGVPSRAWLCFLMCCALGCGSEPIHEPAPAPASQRDAGAGDAAAHEEKEEEDAAVADAYAQLDALVAALLTEYDREVRVTCPCRVEQGHFNSLRACTQRLGVASDHIACASRAFREADSPELRLALRCRIEEWKQRIDCLEVHTCAAEEVNVCYDMMKDCLLFDAEKLTLVAYACPGLFGLP